MPTSSPMANKKFLKLTQRVAKWIKDDVYQPVAHGKGLPTHCLMHDMKQKLRKLVDFYDDRRLSTDWKICRIEEALEYIIASACSNGPDWRIVYVGTKRLCETMIEVMERYAGSDLETVKDAAKRVDHVIEGQYDDIAFTDTEDWDGPHCVLLDICKLDQPVFDETVLIKHLGTVVNLNIVAMFGFDPSCEYCGDPNDDWRMVFIGSGVDCEHIEDRFCKSLRLPAFA